MSSRVPPPAPVELTAEQRKALVSHAAKWIANALSTQPVAPDRLVPAVHALYAATALKPPRVVVASSPIVMMVAAGFAAAIGWVRRNKTWAQRNHLAWDADGIRREGADPSARRVLELAIRVATEQALPPISERAKVPSPRHGLGPPMEIDSRPLATGYAIDQPSCALTEHFTRGPCALAADPVQRDRRLEVARELTKRSVHEATHHATQLATSAALQRVTHGAASPARRAETDRLLARYRAPERPRPAASEGDVETGAAGHQARERAAIRQSFEWSVGTEPGSLKPEPLAARIALLAYDLGAELGIDFQLLLSCVDSVGTLCQGGNMESSVDSYLSACRDVLGPVLPEHEKYRTWECCALEGGMRIVHDEFCIVSDRPEVLKVDGQNRPHCADGPSHRWRDGWSLYHWHGTYLPAEYHYLILAPEQITMARIDNEGNAEMRRVMIERYGAARYDIESSAMVVEELPANHRIIGLRSARLLHRLVRVGHLVPNTAGFQVETETRAVYVDLLNSTPEPDGTVKRYLLRVDPRAYGGDASRYVQAAVASTWRNADGSLTFRLWQEYNPDAES